MKNINILISTVLVTILFFGCGKDDPKLNEIKYKICYSYNSEQKKPIEGAIIDFYSSEADFLIKKNKVSSLKTDANGEASHKIDNSKFLWYYAYKDSLNSVASGARTIRINSSNSTQFEQYNKNLETSLAEISGGYIRLHLLTTPIKVQIKAFKQGLPLKNVSVKIYLNKKDRDNNRIYSISDFDNEYSIYQNTNLAGLFEDILNPTIQYTDSEGIANIRTLSPQQYWIKIDGKNTIPETIGKLADNADITNYFELASP